MASPSTSSKPFQPGASGWSAADLNDPEIERRWDAGRFEIVEGVLTPMAPAYLDASRGLRRLLRLVESHLEATGSNGEFALEVDFVLSESRVARVDAVYMTSEDDQRQREENTRHGRQNLAFGRLLVPPTLVVESVSLGHEVHDRATKKLWYAEAGVPNYWIFDAYQKSLECLILTGKAYGTDQSGRGTDILRPSLFPGLTIPLGRLWV